MLQSLGLAHELERRIEDGLYTVDIALSDRMVSLKQTVISYLRTEISSLEMSRALSPTPCGRVAHREHCPVAANAASSLLQCPNMNSGAAAPAWHGAGKLVTEAR